MTLKYLKDKDPWMLAEDIPDMDFFFSQIWLRCFVDEFSSPSGLAYKKILAVFRDFHHLWFYFGEKDSFDVGENIVQKFLRKPAFAEEVNHQIVREADILRKFAERLPEDNFEKLTAKQLWQYYARHDAVHTRYYKWCWIPVAVDMFHNNLTDAFKNYLRWELKVPEGKLNEVFTLLTQPTQKSLIQLEQEEFLEIAAKIQKDPFHKSLFKKLYSVFEGTQAIPYGLSTHTPEYEAKLEARSAELKGQIKPRLLKLIEAHYEKYFYVKFLWIGKDGVNSFEYYLKELVKFVGHESPASKLLRQKRQELNNTLCARSKLIRKYGIRGKWLTLCDAFGDFMVTKIYRRYAQIYAIYRMQPILQEIARRLHISLAEVRSMLGEEIRAGLLRGRVDRAGLRKRGDLFVVFAEKGWAKIFVGGPAEKLARMVAVKDYGEVAELTGQVGCVGKAKGRVKIIIRPSDMTKMNKGDILVSIATDPDIVPAMKKAAAIVTEQGGVTSHAAIVSRELNIPCVIGTKIATKVFKDGDMVEVDASKGIVRKL